MDIARPWLRHYGNVPAALSYPETTLYGALAQSAARAPEAVALDFFATSIRYRELVALVERCAAGLHRLGLLPGERLLVAMPTTPHAVIAFYAANRLGATAAMVHPLSTAAEIDRCLEISGARMALTLDAFHDRFSGVVASGLEDLVIARIPEFLGPVERAVFWWRRGRRIARVPPGDTRVKAWPDLLASGQELPPPCGAPDDVAAILFSGGTTSEPKAIALTNRNFIAQGLQAATWVGLGRGGAILAILPLFHGFGLAVCVNAALMAGGRSILVPEFKAALAARVIRDKRPNFLVGPPTLFDALTREPSLARADLSCLTAAFCGADTLARPVKERFEALVARRGGRIELLEGYGLTEAVSGVMAMPSGEHREGSIGIPFPDTLVAICEPRSARHLPPGKEGEICVSSPAVMKGYVGDLQATAMALRYHADGRLWLHTGDLGRMDADGFFYFVGRLKRMIKSSGFNVYPAQVEAVLHAHPAVRAACVIGVPDPAQVERVKAFVVPVADANAGPQLEEELIAHCRTQLIKWSCPREIEFRPSLPTTAVGKIDYRRLSAESNAHARR
jgi:long-chain acyl-CoA synthetase